MTIARRLKDHLEAQGVSYETAEHPRTATASETAEAAHVSGHQLAKTVLLHLEDRYMLAVVPSSHRVDLGTLHELLGHRLSLASETEIARIFDDCDRGAVPPVGAAYGVPTMLDESLLGLDRVWFEGGDHRTVVSVAGGDFDRLLQHARRGSFAERT
jgi:Ala-tRNA(Pro) deacylase